MNIFNHCKTDNVDNLKNGHSLHVLCMFITIPFLDNDFCHSSVQVLSLGGSLHDLAPDK